MSNEFAEVAALSGRKDEWIVTKNTTSKARSGFAGDVLKQFAERLAECENLACGDDSSLIGVRVKVDIDGTVLADPVVIGMYTDCL